MSSTSISRSTWATAFTAACMPSAPTTPMQPTRKVSTWVSLPGLVLMSVLYLRETTLTDTLRQALYLYVDVFLPYYVASRGLRQISDFKDAMLAFVLTAFVMALIAVAEYVRHWLLYSALVDAMGVPWSMSGYLSRGGALRASVTTGA